MLENFVLLPSQNFKLSWIFHGLHFLKIFMLRFLSFIRLLAVGFSAHINALQAADNDIAAAEFVADTILNLSVGMLCINTIHK